MTVNDIIALAGAGFTRDDIFRIAQTVPTQAPVQNQVQTLASAPATAPASVPVQGQATGGFSPLESKIDNITGLLQGMNIANSQITAQPTTDDMLASIINPPNLTGGVK